MKQLTIHRGIPVYHECGTILDDYAILCIDFAIENTNRNYGEVYRIRGMKFSIDYRINISVIISKKYIQPRKIEKVKELIFTFPKVAPPANVIEPPKEMKGKNIGLYRGALVYHDWNIYVDDMQKYLDFVIKDIKDEIIDIEVTKDIKVTVVAHTRKERKIVYGEYGKIIEIPEVLNTLTYTLDPVIDITKKPDKPIVKEPIVKEPIAKEPIAGKYDWCEGIGIDYTTGKPFSFTFKIGFCPKCGREL